jgi:hypothetical protein
MRRAREGADADGAEVRFGIDEWLGAVAALGMVLAAAAAALGFVYWVVIPR